MDIGSQALSSAIFAGFATDDFADDFLNAINRAVLGTANLVSRISGWLSRKLPGWNFFKQWFANDPVGATAGALLGVVVIVVAGAWIGGAIGGLWGLWGAGLMGKAAVILGGLTLGAAIGAAIRWGVRGVQFIWRFNWAQSDDELALQQRAVFNSLYGQLGATLGSFVGSACGWGTVAIAKRVKPIKLNPEIMARLDEISKGPWWGDSPPELADEVVENVKALLRITRNATAQYAFIEGYKNVRKWVRNFADVTQLEQIYPRLGELIENWGVDSGNWSFAQWTEEKIESISDSRLRLFTEEFIESIMDSCTESLMIVSHAFG